MREGALQLNIPKLPPEPVQYNGSIAALSNLPPFKLAATEFFSGSSKNFLEALKIYAEPVQKVVQ